MTRLSGSVSLSAQVKTNAAERYSVRPHMALLSPGATKVVQCACCLARMRVLLHARAGHGAALETP